MLFPFAYASYAGQTHASQPLFERLIHNLSMRVLAFLFLCTSPNQTEQADQPMNRIARIQANSNTAAPITLSRLRCFRSLPILPQLIPHPYPLISPVSKLSGFSSAVSLQHIRAHQLPLSPPPELGARSSAQLSVPWRKLPAERRAKQQPR